MVNSLLGFVTSFLLWLASKLPNSPIQTIVFGSDGFGNGYTIAKVLGWVNWLIPFSEMYTLLMAWLAAAIAFIMIRVFAKRVVNVASSMLTLGEGGF